MATFSSLTRGGGPSGEYRLAAPSSSTPVPFGAGEIAPPGNPAGGLLPRGGPWLRLFFRLD